MSIAKTRQFFDDHAFRKNDEDIDKILFLEESRSLRELLANQHGVVLDVGCGDGVYAREIATWRKNLFIVGIDISIESIRQAEQQKVENVNYFVCDVAHLPFRKEAFDAIYAVNALHHTGDPMLRSATKVLRKKGIFFISDHVIENPFAFAMRIIFPLLPKKLKSLRTDASAEGQVPPIFLYSVPWLNGALNTYGFRLIYSEHFEVFSTIWLGVFKSFLDRSSNAYGKLLKIWFILNVSENRLLRRFRPLRNVGYRIRVCARLDSN